MYNEFHGQVRGRGHERAGLPGQDRTAHLSRGGVRVLALADGAGSSARSDIGARVVVDLVCAIFAERFQEFHDGDAASARREIVGVLTDRLAIVAARRGIEMRDLASTLLVVAIAGDRFICAHVGDGAIGYVKNGAPLVVSHPDNGEFANQTTFVTSTSAASSVRMYRGSMDGVRGFILMSDGACSSLYDSTTATLAPACRTLVEVVASAAPTSARRPAYKRRLTRFLSTRIRAGTTDDCSVGILARRR